MLLVTGNRILVKVINEPLSKILVIPQNTRPLSNAVKAEILNVGSKVKADLKKGDKVLVSDYTGLRLEDGTRIYDVTPDSVYLKFL